MVSLAIIKEIPFPLANNNIMLLLLFIVVVIETRFHTQRYVH